MISVAPRARKYRGAQLIDDFPSDSLTTLAARAATPAGALEFNRLAADYSAAAAALGLASPATSLAPSLSSPVSSAAALPGWLSASPNQPHSISMGGAAAEGRAKSAARVAATRAARAALAVSVVNGRSKRGAWAPRVAAAAVPDGVGCGLPVRMPWVPMSQAEPMIAAAVPATNLVPTPNPNSAVAVAGQAGSGSCSAADAGPAQGLSLWSLTRLLPQE